MIGLTENDILKFSFDQNLYKPLKWHGIRPTPVSRSFDEWESATPEQLESWFKLENSIIGGAIDIRNIDTGEILERVNCKILKIVGRRSDSD